MKIEGSVALVTGANRGLGKALVSALIEGGAAKVYAAARDTRQVAADGSRVVPLTLDTPVGLPPRGVCWIVSKSTTDLL